MVDFVSAKAMDVTRVNVIMDTRASTAKTVSLKWINSNNAFPFHPPHQLAKNARKYHTVDTKINHNFSAIDKIHLAT